MKVSNSGEVVITYPQDVDEHTTDMRVIVNKFSKTKFKKVLDEAVVFNDDAKDDILRILNEEKDALKNLRSIEEKIQLRLPENFRVWSRHDKLEQ